MKITLCGSIAFYDEMLAAKKQLEGEGCEILGMWPIILNGNLSKINSSSI
jgi:hypothetical protein